MDRHVSRAFLIGLAPLLVLALAACGGNQDAPTGTQVLQAAQQPLQTVLTADAAVAGVTPFIAFVTLRGSALANLSSVNFVIAPQAGTVSKPVSVTYSMAYLTSRGDAVAGAGAVTVPIFGLYAGAANAVSLKLAFSDLSTDTLPVTVTTAAYVDANQIYDRPTIVQARAAGSVLDFDFLYMKSSYGSPVVIDTDGNVRWIGPTVATTPASDFVDGGFVMGSSTSADIYRLEFDGTYSTTGSLAATGVLDFGHDIEPGKTGLLDNVDATIGGATQWESTAQEFTPDGRVVATWDLAAILSAAMTAGGDDPTLFVRPGADWFHMNTAIYDASDDSVIISSRENFVIKLDYQTGAIRWIFGDPTKYWYTFPSLRAKALTLVGPGLVPIGQHAVSIAPDGSMLLFNDGTPSVNQPTGAPAGQARTYSAVSDYHVDTAALTATDAWDFDDGQSLYSQYCSSAHQVAGGSVLVDYAEAANGVATHIVGLGPTRSVVFDIQYANKAGCNTAWNAQPLAMEALVYN